MNISKKEFDKLFLAEVNKQFGKYIESRCNHEANRNFDPTIGPDDLVQEVYIRLLRHTSKAAMERSEPGKIWIPYVKMILRNVFMDIRESRINQYGRIKMVSSDNNSLATDIDEEQYSANPEALIECKEFYMAVRNRVKPEYQVYLDEIISPSPKFRNFLIKKTPKTRTVKVTKTIAAKYFDIPYKKMLKIYDNIEKAFNNTLNYA